MINEIPIKKNKSKKSKRQSTMKNKKTRATLKAHYDNIKSDDTIREVLDKKMRHMTLTQIENVR